MKINEAEELLGISKANIRFYEKEGLLTPRRGENRYRDYSEEDLDRLREIVILRKLGISVQDIKQILDGELLLGNAMTANIANLEAQISQLTGALKIQRVQITWILVGAHLRVIKYVYLMSKQCGQRLENY